MTARSVALQAVAAISHHQNEIARTLFLEVGSVDIALAVFHELEEDGCFLRGKKELRGSGKKIKDLRILIRPLVDSQPYF